MANYKLTLADYKEFNPARDAAVLYNAMDGAGTDEQAIIDIVANRILKQRLGIDAIYFVLYERDLKENLKSELSGYFAVTILAMFYRDEVRDARFLNAAIAGAGTDEECLIDILTTRTNSQIGKIKEAYKKLYDVNLQAAIEGDTSGNFRNLMVILVQGKRDESAIVEDKVTITDAYELYRAGEGAPGTNEDKFNEILGNRNFPQLRSIFSKYDELAGHSIKTALSNGFSGNLLIGLMAIVEFAYSPTKYFAGRLKYAIEGAGTQEDIIIRTVVSRCEIDLAEIKEEYQKLANQSLYSAIEGDTSGYFRTILLSLVGK